MSAIKSLVGTTINSPRQSAKFISENFEVPNDSVYVLALSSNFFETSVEAVYEKVNVATQDAALDFYADITEKYDDWDGDEAISYVVIRTENDNVFVEKNELESIFSNGHVLDSVVIDTTNKTWYSDMCEDTDCCDRNNPPSYEDN